MRAREPKAAHAVDATDRPQEISKPEFTIVIRVHRLPEENDFGHPLGDNSLDFANDVGEASAALWSARGRNDAVGALVIASALHRDPRFDFVEAARLEILVVLL